MAAIDSDMAVINIPSRHMRTVGGLKAGQNRVGLLLLLPAAVAFAAVILYPVSVRRSVCRSSNTRSR
jgi:multiple sugar transport system permease protein